MKTRAVTAIEKIKAKLSKYPDARYSESLHGISVPPRDRSGFTVGLSVTDGGFTVFFNGWHEEFETEESALNCFAFGLSPDCRLAVSFFGPWEVKWVVEALENGVWTPDSETGLFLPIWRYARVEYRQNQLLQLDRRPHPDLSSGSSG